MLSDQIKDYVNAAFSGLWVQTHESDEAEREIQQACAANGWKAFVWDITGQAHEYMPALPNASDLVGTLGAVNALAERPELHFASGPPDVTPYQTYSFRAGG